MPWPDRSVEEWTHELDQDYGLIVFHVKDALDEELNDSARSWALAVKEARRLENDLHRMAEKAGVTREQIRNVGPL